LCSKLLKAKYYPNGELVDMFFLSEASLTWKAIEHGLDLVKRGIIWRIGSGSRVQIWRDLWIARALFRKISLKKGRSRLRWVSKLVVPGRRESNESLLKECMFDHDVCKVLKLRLSNKLQDDQVAWFYE
jgi:hypothetical protein